MNLRTLQKLGGLSLIVGSALLAAYSALFTTLLPVADLRRDFARLIVNPNWIGIAVVAFFGVVLMMAGLVAAYTRMYAGSGMTGFLGFLLVELAYLLQAGKVTWEIFLYPLIARHETASALFRERILQTAPLPLTFKAISSITIFAGIVLFCLALIRSKEFPKSAGVLIFSGALLYGLGPVVSILVAIVGIVIHSVGCLILGLGLIRSRSAIAEPAPLGAESSRAAR